MNIFLFALLLIGTVSIPPFISSQYIQPLPLLALVIITLRSCKLSPSSGSYSFLVIGATITLLSAYSLIFQQLSLVLILSYITCGILLSTGFILSSNLRRLPPRISGGLIVSTCLIPLFVFASIIFDYTFPGILDNIKSNPSLAEEFLQLRAKSGMLPEPSFTGPTCSLSYLFLCCQLHILQGAHLPRANATLVKSLSFVFTLASVAISLSASSMISSLGYLTIAFLLTGDARLIAYQVNSLTRKARLSLGFARTLIILVLVFVCITAFYASRDSSRIQLIFNSAMQGSFSLSQDESTIDRSLSSVFGLETPFVNLFGFGVNGFSSALEHCNKFSLARALQINCINAVSNRNHNTIANYVQDFGMLGIFYLLIICKLLTLRLNRFKILTFFMLLWACVTPNSLASPLFWLALASIVFISIRSINSDAVYV